MKRLFLIAAAAAIPLAVAEPASAEWYGAVSIGQADSEIEGVGVDEGLSYGAALGTSWGPLRLEAGVDRISGDLNLGYIAIDTSALDYSLAAYVDLPLGDNASLFAGASVDYVGGQAEILTEQIDASGQGYSWMIGGAYRLNDRMIAEVQWRQLTADLDAEYDGYDLGEVELVSNIATVGLRLEL